MGGSGGGGSSGKVDYPDYMKTWHSQALDDAGVDTFTTSMTEVMESALGSSPWALATPYDPDVDITAWEAALTAFNAVLAGIVPTTDWGSLFSQAVTSIAISDVAGVAGITEPLIVADRDAFANSIDDEILTKVLPRFEGGMRNINAVMSSAFVIGASIIEGFRNREVAKHESGLRFLAAEKNANILLSVADLNIKKNIALQGLRVESAKQMVQIFLSRIAWQEAYAKTVIESRRIKIVAKSEEASAENEIDKADALWDLEVFKYGGNLLASIGSASVQEGPTGPSKAQSAIGGAMAGAGAGYIASGGNPMGAVAGGVLGFASGFM